MPTSKEYRHRAEERLRLANETKEIFARMALLELVTEFRAIAQQLELRERRANTKQRFSAAAVRMYPSGEHRGLGGTAALDGGLARPALGECGDVLGQPIDVEDMGIEVVREPFFEFAMALVVGIGDGLEEFGIAVCTENLIRIDCATESPKRQRR